jgi:hypothetical protein
MPRVAATFYWIPAFAGMTSARSAVADVFSRTVLRVPGCVKTKKVSRVRRIFIISFLKNMKHQTYAAQNAAQHMHQNSFHTAWYAGMTD